MGALCGSVVWEHCVGALCGSVVWEHCVGALCGSIVCEHCVGALRGLFGEPLGTKSDNKKHNRNKSQKKITNTQKYQA